MFELKEEIVVFRKIDKQYTIAMGDKEIVVIKSTLEDNAFDQYDSDTEILEGKEIVDSMSDDVREVFDEFVSKLN